MMVTSFWHPDGTPMSAQQFLEMLFGKLPDFFKTRLNCARSGVLPTRARSFCKGLAEKGFGSDQMAEMQRVINAEKSDLFDVLAHVAYALPPLTREERATNAKVVISTHFNTKQQGVPRFCSLPIRQSRRAGTGPRKAVTFVKAQVQQRYRRRRGRLGQAGRDWEDLLWLPEVPLPASGMMPILAATC